MRDNNTYYGSDKRDSISYLEFGSIDIDNSKKKIWGYWQDQDAYDLYMFSRYARDLFLFRDFFEDEDKSIINLNRYVEKSAHNKLIDYIFKYAGVRALLDSQISERSICESGSSLWGFIEEVQATDLVFDKGNNIDKINELTYLSSDIADMMLRGACVMHPGVKFLISKAPTVAELMDEYTKIGLYYGLSVSLRYALRKSDDLLKVANNSNLAILNRVSLSFEEDREILAGTGKHGYVISIPRLIEICKQNEIFAYYTTENMQKEKDGKGTIRVSLAISKDKNIIGDFMEKYDSYIEKVLSSNVFEYSHGEWNSIENIIKER